MSQQQTEFERRAQAVLRESAEQLDGATRSRLTQARYAALEAAGRSKPIVRSWLLPAGVAAAAVLAIAIVLRPGHDAEPGMTARAGVDDLDIVTAEDSLEFYRDVDFYVWYADQDDAAAPDNEV